MGVHGLWRLIEPSGKPVPLETLENKVLAVDVSIWLHQIVKGFQDNRGASVPNVHLLGIYHRVCKLLYFRIKPVFVFDGGVPVLKKNTIALRNQQKLKNQSVADRIHKNLLSALVKHTAISKVLSEKTKAAIAASTSPTKKPKQDDDLYVLPPPQLDSTVSSSDEDSEHDTHRSRHFDLHSIDTKSVEFRSLPADVRHEILSDLKDTRKQNSWGRINELPTESNDFSIYQMKRLLKRQSVQTALEDVEKEMGGHSLSLGDLEQLLKDQGVITNIKGTRIASDENTRFLLIKDLKQALEDAKKSLAPIEEETDDQKDEDLNEAEAEKIKNKGEEEFEDDLKKAIALSLEEAPSTSKEAVEKPSTSKETDEQPSTSKASDEQPSTSKESDEQPSTSTEIKKVGRKGKNRMPLSFLADFEDADFGDSESSEEEAIITRLTPAQRYMMEYSGLTSHAIANIIASNSGISKKINLHEEKKATKVNIQPAESTTKDESFEGQRADSTNISVGNAEVSIKPNDDNTINDQRVEFSKDIEGKSEETLVTTSTEAEENKLESSVEVTDQVEVMSDSGSSDADDFVDVGISQENGEAMEVIIKPDEVVDDDFFKDIFEVDSKISSSQDEVVESCSEKDNEKTASEEKVEEEPEDNDKKEEEIKTGAKSTSQTMMAKIGKMIETYSRPKDREPKQTEEESSKLSVEQLNEMKENLRKEQSVLVAERSNKERLAGNITDQMCQEAQELLELFGVPYLVAPMEAEAQCAFLDLVNLSDGTITDDSDIWLFGGQTVYKNFFDQNKIVMEFKSESIHHHYKLTREQMILLAMLVGSDYTTGLAGVGPVTALEILAAFPPKNNLMSGLAEFKSWFKKGKLPGPGRTSLRGKLKNVSFNETFPNPQIANAYLEPTVETSKDTFTWGKPDVPGLVEFARQKFGWTKMKSEEILNPILRRLQDKHSQKPITDFFKYEMKTVGSEAEKKMSKRVKTAVDRIAKGPCNETEDEIVEKKKKQVRRKKNGGESAGPKAKKKKQGKKNDEEVDEEIKILKETEERSKIRVEEIEKEVHREVEEQKIDKKVNLQRLHKKEVIPQRQKDKSDVLKNKLKAIEVFRKSKQGPGHVKKRGKLRSDTQRDASYLSEGSSSD